MPVLPYILFRPQTYEVFEKDPVKYVTYENAVCQALLDRVPESDTDEYQVSWSVGLKINKGHKWRPGLAEKQRFYKMENA